MSYCLHISLILSRPPSQTSIAPGHSAVVYRFEVVVLPLPVHIYIYIYIYIYKLRTLDNYGIFNLIDNRF